MPPKNTTINQVYGNFYFILILYNSHYKNRLVIMKKVLILTVFIISILFSGNILAQSPQQIGFVDSDKILEMLPEKVKATEKLTDLNNKYKAELQVMQNDYNKKYSDFISYQTSMAENIRLRRMQELYEIEKNIKDFMTIAQKDIDEQETQLLLPLRKKVKDAIYAVGVEQRFICIYDLANPAIIFVTPDGVDITTLVKQKLGIR